MGPIINKNAPANDPVNTLFMAPSAAKLNLPHSIPGGSQYTKVPTTEERVVVGGPALEQNSEEDVTDDGTQDGAESKKPSRFV
jgi:hypothetical protein